MPIFLKALFVLLVALFCISCASLPEPRLSWKRAGPIAGSEVFSLVDDGTGVLYAAARGGVFRSTDRGGHWNLCWRNQSGGASDVAALPGDVLVAVRLTTRNRDGEVVRSMNGGEQWTSVALPPENDARARRNTLAVDPRSGVIALSGANGLYLSGDSGRSWKSRTFLTTWSEKTPRAIALHGDRLYGLMDRSVAVIGADSVGHELVVDPARNRTPFDAWLLPRDGSVIVSVGYRGLFRSTDRGDHWSAMLPLARDRQAMLIAEGAGGELYVAVAPRGGRDSGHVELLLRFDDGGMRWDTAARDLPFRSLHCLYPLGPREMLAGTSGGVYHSTDGGESWQPSNDGIIGASVTSLVVRSDGTLGALANERIVTSTDGGETWIDRTPGGGARTLRWLTALRNGALLVGIDTDGTAPLLISTDLGISWRDTIIPRGDAGDAPIVESPSGVLYAPSRKGLFVSVDHGTTWRLALTQPVQTVAFLQGGMPVVGGADGKVYRPVDGTWSGMAAMGGCNSFPALAVDRNDAIYFGSACMEGFVGSMDYGESWTYMSGGVAGSVLAMAVAPDGRLYCGTNGQGIMYSEAEH